MAVLTISRMFGTGANELGELIAQRLGYSFFNNQLIQMVAQQAKVSTDWVASMEKEAGGKFQKFLSTLVPKSLMEVILSSDHGLRDEEIYTDMLSQVITKIADEGDAIILGRGSQFILKDRPDTYHLLLVADLENRIGYVQKRFELTKKQAVLAVAMEDKRRVNLYRKFGKVDYNQTDHYHLVLNMRNLNMSDACDMLCTLLGSSRV
ncbi:MAG: cytidylate kinase-like family protein [Desulfobacterales bacterium]|nr:cytidylate kinase-like family protein [Desulfobacterales bacterium]